MSPKLMLAAAALATSALPAFAQSTVPGGPANPATPLPYDRGYDKPSERADAVNAAEGPVTDQLNRQANGAATVQAADAGQPSPQAQAQYDADRAAYMTALTQHDRAIDRTDARYARQQLAYADAMAAWRDQVYACQHGHHKACDLPPPTPDQFY